MLKKYIWYFLKFSEILMYQTFLYENIDLKVLYIMTLQWSTHVIHLTLILKNQCMITYL